MDFLDPQKQKAHRIRLLVGYVLIGMLVTVATIVLLYQAYGFGINSNGQLIQNGLVFISSEPAGANILLNGTQKAQTNARLNIPAGQYTVEVERDGYLPWQRSIGVEGGSVEHFDYPFLVPASLKPSALAKYVSKPNVLLQSPDQRWLLVPNDAAFGQFDQYDLAHPKNAVVDEALPAGVLTASTGTQSWQTVAWASDNAHVLLRHVFAAGAQTASEYILFDRADATQTVNLSRTLGSNPDSIEFKGGAFDQYYEYTQASQTLSTSSLGNPAPVTVLQHVLAFKSSGGSNLLYVDGSASGKPTVKLRQGSTTYTLGRVAEAPTYLLALGQYKGDWYVTFAASTDTKVDVYENPAAQLSVRGGVLVPVSVLKVASPSALNFAPGNQFVMAEAGQNLAVFDTQNAKTYTYELKVPLDAPQPYVTWMDGSHLLFVSGGKAALCDFDGANERALSLADASYVPVFDPNYHTLYTIAPQTAAATGAPATGYELTSTSMLTPADQ